MDPPDPGVYKIIKYGKLHVNTNFEINLVINKKLLTPLNTRRKNGKYCKYRTVGYNIECKNFHIILLKYRKCANLSK
jgi:hypothetical protein